MPVQRYLRQYQSLILGRTERWYKLFVKHLELRLVEIAEALFRDGDDIPVPVVTFAGDGVDFGVVTRCGNGDGDVPVEDAEGGQDVVVDGYAGVVGEALIAGNVVKVISAHDWECMRSVVGGLITTADWAIGVDSSVDYMIDTSRCQCVHEVKLEAPEIIGQFHVAHRVQSSDLFFRTYRKNSKCPRMNIGIVLVHIMTGR